MAFTGLGLVATSTRLPAPGIIMPVDSENGCQFNGAYQAAKGALHRDHVGAHDDWYQQTFTHVLKHMI